MNQTTKHLFNYHQTNTFETKVTWEQSQNKSSELSYFSDQNTFKTITKNYFELHFLGHDQQFHVFSLWLRYSVKFPLAWVGICGWLEMAMGDEGDRLVKLKKFDLVDPLNWHLERF